MYCCCWDIESSTDVEILNPDCHIHDDKVNIRMEFIARTGRGYVPAEKNRSEDEPVGLIPIDSLFHLLSVSLTILKIQGGANTRLR